MILGVALKVAERADFHQVYWHDHRLACNFMSRNHASRGVYAKVPKAKLRLPHLHMKRIDLNRQSSHPLPHLRSSRHQRAQRIGGKRIAGRRIGPRA